MQRFKAHWLNWLFVHVVSPFCRRWRPIIVIPPWPQRLMLRLFRRDVPTPLRPLALIWRYDDVVEVLGDHERFSVSGYDEKMRECSNPFMLGMGFTREYQDDISLLRRVLQPEDRDRIRKIAARHSGAGIAAARDGRIDVVQQVVAPVMAAFVDEYLGVPALPGQATIALQPVPQRISPLLHLFLDTATYMFNVDILTGGPKYKKAATDAGKTIAAHIGDVIKRKRSGAAGPAGDTVLDRLLACQGVPDELVQTIIGGTVSGAIAVTFSQCLWVIDRLLDLPPTQLAEVENVARGNDEALLGRYVREASRFKPFPPALLRRCDSDQVIAEHTSRKRTLRAGTVVASLTWSAAFDSNRVRNPLQFHVGRGDGDYLLFGTGQHHCVAAQPERPFAQTLMIQMVKALFARGVVRRTAGADGFIQGDDSGGQWPAHFVVEIDAARLLSAVPPAPASDTIAA